MKLKHIAIIGSLFLILFSLVLFFGVLISADSDDENSNFYCDCGRSVLYHIHHCKIQWKTY